VTWGQFFIYQGFNERLGWMHTSGGGDVIDEYLETVVERDGKFFYKYGNEERPMRSGPSRCRTKPRTAWPAAASPPTSPTTVR
jgi:acyl-homoserine lactone acylase PvdQ